MSIPTLKTLIDENPTALSGLNDEMAATYINTVNQPGPRRLSALDIVESLGYTTGKYILDYLETNASTNNVLKYALKALESGESIDINNQATKDIIDLLVSSFGFESDKADALKALENNQQSLAQKYGLQRVTATDVTLARS